MNEHKYTTPADKFFRNCDQVLDHAKCLGALAHCEAQLRNAVQIIQEARVHATCEMDYQEDVVPFLESIDSFLAANSPTPPQEPNATGIGN